VEHINEAVQRILDRLIFIRYLEDRGIESENGLLSMLNAKENIYPHLIPLFRNLDVEYNGLLFKEHFSETINIDDLTIKGVIKQLYPPYSPYAFDMIEPEILGRIYERFLGSKIRLTESHQAKVEEKPEVRHAGGVYYTPEYIVDYIVENTVGVKIKDKSPEEIEAVKICDPACG
jgi:type I restriction-modification system DNA methylase subunit